MKPSLDKELLTTMECIGIIGDMVKKDNGDKLDLLSAQAKLLHRYNNKLKEWNKTKEYNLVMAYQYGTDPYGDRV